MIGSFIVKTIADGTPSLSNNVFENISEDDVPNPHVVITVDPVAGGKYHNVKYAHLFHDLFIVEVYAQSSFGKDNIDITKSIDASFMNLISNQSPCGEYVVDHICPTDMKNWKRVDSTKTKGLVMYIKTYSVRYKRST